MLTIEQLRAMPEAERAAYLRQCARQFTQDEKRAGTLRKEAMEMREEASIKEGLADGRDADARSARAYFATLEAAGLWPLPPWAAASHARDYPSRTCVVVGNGWHHLA